ncbi:FecR family protein [Flavobacteriaceae bacterium LMO-SS05]|jgi:ferric-dicitrate binding protein FerR (iron transport regulator)
MEKHNQDETFLARWISGELTSEELKAFKKSKDYPVFKRINESSQRLESPIFDQQSVFNNLVDYQTNQSKKPVKLIPNWAYALAASIVIALGLFYILNAESHFKTGFGQQLAVVLPDNSKVQLNSNSELNFKSLNWKNNRELNLNGEAFFDVEKGQSFEVHTDEGVVEVLGTEFNVISRAHYFEVRCREGKVRVTSIAAKTEAILLPGKALRIVNNTLEKWDYNINEPNWLIGESTFQNTPISQVILALENQFEISFDTSNVNLSERFTGGFTHKDLKLALNTVMIPMDITYSVDHNKIILKNSGN